MKRRKAIAISVVLFFIFIVTVLIISFVLMKKVELNDGASAMLRYNYNGTDISTLLTEEDSKIVADMFNDKELFFDPGAACPFGEQLSLSFNNGIFGSKFYPSCDGCHNVLYNGKLLSLSDTEQEQLRGILEKYGVEFPCL